MFFGHGGFWWFEGLSIAGTNSRNCSFIYFIRKKHVLYLSFNFYTQFIVLGTKNTKIFYLETEITLKSVTLINCSRWLNAIYFSCMNLSSNDKVECLSIWTYIKIIKNRKSCISTKSRGDNASEKSGVLD